jgi:tetratricopeptide (TPR) repeat protein
MRTFKTMKPAPLVFAVAMMAGLAGCGVPFTHVKPGESARVALETRDAPNLSSGSLAIVAQADGDEGLFSSRKDARTGSTRGGLAIPAVEPPLPVSDPLDETSRAPEAFRTGVLAQRAGQHAEAIAAFESVVKLKPDFTEAWTRLIRLYEQTGDQGSAAVAYKKLKQLNLPSNRDVTAGSGLTLGLAH